MVYVVYYTCPKCKHPCCGEEAQKKANECIEAASKADARKFFNTHKPCRHMKICEIKESD